jgi:hypothetical protein
MSHNTNLPYSPLVRRLSSSTDITRPANTTAYTAGDGVGTATACVQTLNNAAKINSGGGRITAVRLFKSGTTVTNATFTVLFFNAAPTDVADNAAFNLLYAEQSRFIASVALSTMTVQGSGGGFAFTLPSPMIYYQTAQGSKALYAVIIATAAYTPASAETFALSVTVETTTT